MAEMIDAHFLTVVITVASIMVTPFYILAVYVFSGASALKGLQVGSAFLIWGAVMVWVCLQQIPDQLGIAGSFIVPVVWILPTLILFGYRDWFLNHEMSQKWLVGLQLFRVIGGVFLIEMASGHIHDIFAYPAGISDIVVGLAALGVLLAYRNRERIPGTLILFIIVISMTDSLSTFFFGFTSIQGFLQLFFPAVPNRLIMFPSGMIPFFWVSYAIFFHGLSLLTYFKFQRRHEKETA